MTVPEFHAWVAFYKQNPFDDYHRFYRPAALISNSMSGREFDDSLAWLEKRPSVLAAVDIGAADRFSAADIATIQALRMKKKG